MEKRNVYQYDVKLNMDHEIFETYEIKLIFKAALIEFESQGFSTYKECVDDCHKVVEVFKTELEERSKQELVMGWEANPKRSQETPHITPNENWEDAEILHIFLFIKQDNIDDKTKPVLSCSIRVTLFDEELALELS